MLLIKTGADYDVVKETAKENKILLNQQRCCELMLKDLNEKFYFCKSNLFDILKENRKLRDNLEIMMKINSNLKRIH